MQQHSSKVKHWVIVPAAGIGSRMAAELPKQYLKISGKSILEHTLQPFIAEPMFSRVLVGLAEHDQYWPELPCSGDEKLQTFVGGNERVDTVINGLRCLEAIASPDDWIWVHDAARPGLSGANIQALTKALEQAPQEGALLGLPVFDTIKRGDSEVKVQSTVDREGVWLAQTPQVFRNAVLTEALKHCQTNKLVVTDESSAIEALGGRPDLVVGSIDNIKVTRPEDLERMRKILAVNNPAYPRIGSGFDVHAFTEGSSVMLGGIEIPHSHGLKAHSDGDVLLHALCDALLGALALGDIGRHFPDSDSQWRGADSRHLLRAVVAMVHAQNYAVGNVDLTVMAEKPKLANHVDAIRACIAKDLGIDASLVSVKATTTEGLGFTGRQEGIACQATALLYAGVGG